jgi:hypothetical protein
MAARIREALFGVRKSRSTKSPNLPSGASPPQELRRLNGHLRADVTLDIMRCMTIPLSLANPLIGAAASWTSKRFARKVHKELSELVFWRDGSRRSLEKIARGEGDAQDIEDLKRIFRTTEARVQRAAKYLLDNRRHITTTFGISTAQLIDEIVDVKFRGAPTGIRNAILRLVWENDLSPESAAGILKEIDHLAALIQKMSPTPALV